MKALITIAWSSTVEMELPDGTGIDDLENYRASNEILELAAKARKEAYDNFRACDGVITDVQENEA